jgi:hypothetical protein
MKRRRKVSFEVLPFKEFHTFFCEGGGAAAKRKRGRKDK